MKKRLFGILLSFALMLTMMPVLGLSQTAYAADPDEWGENKTFDADASFPDGVDITENITVTIAEGKTVTVDNGIYAWGKTLTVEGKGNLIVNGYNNNYGSGGSAFTGNIIVKGGKVTLTGGAGNPDGDNDTGGNGIEGNVEVSGGSFSATGGNGHKVGQAVRSSNTITCKNGIVAQESADGSEWSDISAARDKQYVRTIQTYPLWVGGTRVTSANASNITGGETVTASYTPATTGENPTPAKLTLSGYNNEGAVGDKQAGIYAEGNLIIETTGANNNVANTSTEDSWDCAIRITGDLTLQGSGTLKAKGGNRTIVANAVTIESGNVYTSDGTCGIFGEEGDITIKGGVVNASGSTLGLQAQNVIIKNGTVIATDTQNNGVAICAIINIEIEGGTVTASGGNNAITGTVKNSIAGTGWENADGSGEKADIDTSDEGQSLTFKKVQFPAFEPVASVTPSGGSATEYDDFAAAVTAWNTAGAGATLKLLADVETSSTVSVTAGASNSPMVLDLNGYGICYTGTENNSVINIGSAGDTAGCLELIDNDESSKKHYVTLDENGRGTRVADSGTVSETCVEVTGGYITGGLGKRSYSDTLQGGGVYDGGLFIMEGGTIVGNTADQGGGVYAVGVSAFTMNGGTITGNKASDKGGGFYTNGGTTIKLSGGAVITGNKKGNVKNNLQLPNSKTIEITEELKNTASVGVTMEQVGVFTKSTSPIKASDYKGCFSSDDSTYSVMTEGNELKLSTHEHSFTYTASGATITATCANTDGECPLPEDEGKHVATLTIAAPESLAYDGTAKAATITDENKIQGAAKVQYQKKTGDTYGEATETAPADAGTYKASITLGTGNNSATASVEYTIAQKPVTVSGITASNKVYDGTTAATLNVNSAAVSGIEDGDTVELSTTSATGAFSDKTAGNGKTVTITGLALTGADASNYVLPSQPTTTANITIKEVTVTGITASNKVYDGNTNATVNCGSAVINGKVENDDLTFTAPTGSFSDKTVGEGKTVSFTGLALSGADAANYSLSGQPADTTANITAKPVTITGVTAEDKVYDGDLTATAITAKAAIDGIVDSENVSFVTGTGSFSDKNVGNNKTVSFSDFALTGNDSANYTLASQPADTKAAITAKPVKVSDIKAGNKTYDGTTDATLDCTSASFDGRVGDDNLTVTATGAFADANAGQGKTVNITGLTLGGTGKANYVLAAEGQQKTAEADIAQKSITGATVTLDKTQLTYNGQEQSVSVTGVTTSDGLTLTEKDYVATGNTGKEIGDYTATVEGKGNFKDTATADWKIVEKAMTVKAENVTVTYDGKEHGIKVEVIDPASGAEVKYGTKEGTYDLEESPTIKEPGTLTVYFMAKADKNYSVYTGKAVVTVEKAASTAAKVTANDREYDGTENELVSVTGKAEGGEMQYALGNDAKAAPAGGWSTSIPKAANAGTYYVWYKVAGDAHHKDTAPVCVTVKISEKPAPSKPVAAVKGIAKGKTALKFKWNKVSGAAKYEVWMAKCGKKSTIKMVKTLRAPKTSWTKKKLKKNTAYKFYVVAKDASGNVICKSVTGHAYTGNARGKYTNAKSLKVKKSSFTLNKGGTAKIKATQKKARKGKKLCNHAKLLRYKSNNTSVAKVSSSGKITAVGSGTCTVYVQTVNGIWKTVKVTVN